METQSATPHTTWIIKTKHGYHLVIKGQVRGAYATLREAMANGFGVQCRLVRGQMPLVANRKVATP